METGAIERRTRTALILATACIAMAFWSTCCGGGASTGTVSASTASSSSPASSESTASFSVSSTNITFGSQAIATAGPAQFVTLTNIGTTTLNITNYAITGANASDFAEMNICGSSVAVGASCTIAVLFTPSAAGERVATLSIEGNTSGGSQTVSLSGTGSHDVILSWTPSPDISVVGYYIYRGISPDGENPTPLNSSPLGGTTFTDENVTPGVTYYYLLTAVTWAGVESAYSNEAAAAVPSP